MKRFFALAIILILFTGSYPLSTGDIGFDYSNPQLDKEQYDEFPGETKKVFNVKPGQKLYIDLNTGGEIEIEGWNKDQVEVVAIIEGRDADEIELTINQSSSGVDVETEYEENWGNHNSDVSLFVKVPVKFDVEFHTMGGEVAISNVNGEMEGKTMGGAMDLTNLKGNLELTTMGGGILLKDSEVDGEVKTMGGEVTLENVIGDVDASSMGGAVTHRNVKGKKGPSVGKEVHITTMGGALKVDDAPNGAYLKTMGGKITVESVARFLEAITMGGDIKVRSLDGWAKLKTMGGDVEVKMVGDPSKGERDVQITSMGGDIELIVPAGLSMDIKIELAYTKRYDGDFNIYSDFKIEKESTKEWERDHGSKRKYIYGTGEVGGGKNKIRIKTINGDVYLKKG